MLSDFLIASTLAIVGLSGLSALATDTLELNREIATYTVASSAAADFVGRWELNDRQTPTTPVSNLCHAPTAAWQAEWCADIAVSHRHITHDLQVCLQPEQGSWHVRISWDGVSCAMDDQPQARRVLQ